MKHIFLLYLMMQLHSLVEGAIHYTVSFPKANLHYVTVQISVETNGADHLDFSMPVWTPGSYMVREFSQHIDRFETTGKDKAPFQRLDKNTWRVDSRKRKSVQVEYEVYSFTISARHSYVDRHYAFLHGVSTFMRVEGRDSEAIILTFNPLEQWKNIEVALPANGKINHSYTCANYDLLADSPVALGNFDVIRFTSGKVEHRVVMIGSGFYDPKRIEDDFKKIADAEVNIFGNHPSSPHYIHFIQNVESGGGGLEHLNCQTSQVQRTAYRDKEKYRKFLGLVAHEQFHLWNVKRIRPAELGPFNYNEENYSKQLWVVEGITSYYDDHILLRSGIHTEETYLTEVAGNINRLQNTPGRRHMSLEESSLTAWVKFYLANENAVNTSISYYNKGMLVSLILDLEIIYRTKGSKSLDDVMRALYRFYEQEDRGFTIEEFWQIAEETTGSDLKDFYHKYIVSTDEIDFTQYLRYVGLKPVDQNAEKLTPWLGITTKEEKGKCVIASVYSEGTGAASGLSANDELLAINGIRVTGNGSEDIGMLTIGSEAELLISRGGRIMTINVTVQRNPEVNYKVLPLEKPTEEQIKLKAYWLSDRA